MTAAAWTVTLLALAACGIYARTVLRGHQGGAGRLRCLPRTTAFRATRAAYGVAIWAAGARRARAERGRT